MGTVFDVVRRADKVSVSVERGAVLVRSALLPHGVTRLAAGETVNLEPKPQEHDADASAAKNASAPAPTDDTASAAVSNQAISSAETARSKTSPQVRAQSSWQAAYDAGQFESAYRLIGHEHFARTVKASPSPEELLKLADLARLSGQVAHSVLPLERITTDFKRSAHAPIAAFTLGRIYLDQLHDAKTAAQTFELAISLKPPLALLEDCHARLVRAYAASGDTAKAREAAARYGALFPNGRHLRDIERFKADE